jgi:hypothetical protein
MKKIFLMIVALLTFAEAQARSCQDEPERCPILRLSCVERIEGGGRSSYSYLSAALYDSILSGSSVRVNESRCVRTNVLTCTSTELIGNWEIYKSTNQYTLVNFSSRKTFLLDCQEFRD